MSDPAALQAEGDRLAKVIARSGLCSRRDAEGWIKDGRVTVNGKKVLTPAFNVSDKDKIKVDGEPLAARQGTRVWLYHKPPGLVVTEKDPEGRPTVFEAVAEQGLPRVVSIGRLDINTEGLLLLTNDGGLKRVLELPATGWLRRYRVRAFGTITQPELDRLKDGLEIDGVKYGPIEATLEREQGSNVWLVVALREGKNREVKNVLAELGLQVNRLIRVSFGPFQLGDLAPGGIETVNARVLRDQLGKRLAADAGADFDSDLPEVIVAQKERLANPRLRAAAPGQKPSSRPGRRTDVASRFRFEDDQPRPPRDAEERPRQDRPGRHDAGFTPKAKPKREPDASPARRVLFEDGREGEFRPPRQRKPAEDGEEARPRGAFGDKPRREAGDRPARSFSSKDSDRSSSRGPGDRPRTPRPDGARPARGPSDKPRRDFGDRPPRAAGAEDRPKRSFGDKPRSPRPPRQDGDRPAKSFGDKAAGNKSFGDRPARKFAGADGKPRSAAPGSRPRPGGGKPGGPPPGPRPGGDKPRAPRKPRA